MPKMEISDDVNYMMRIKEYENYYKPYEPELKFELLPGTGSKKVSEESKDNEAHDSGK